MANSELSFNSLIALLSIYGYEIEALKNSQFYLQIENRLELQTFRPFIILSQKETFKQAKIIEVYKLLSHMAREKGGNHTILAGGYACYLEGLTKNYNDVDMFIITNYLSTSLLINYIDVIVPSIIKYLNAKGCVTSLNMSNYSHSIAAVITSLRIKAYYVDLKVSIEYNVVITNLLSPMSYELPWMKAAKNLCQLFDMAIPAVCLTPGGEALVRFRQASLFMNFDEMENRVKWFKSILRQIKYEMRLNHFGKPASLLQQSLRKVQKMDSVAHRELFRY